MNKQEQFKKIEISKNELKEMVYLKENGMSDTDIAKYFTKKGKAISSTTVGKRLLEYYDKKGKIKPRGVKKEHKKRIILTEEELKEMSELKADGLSYKSIAEYFKANYNKNLTTSIVRTRLLEYHNTHEKSKPRRKRKYDDDIKEILMTGISIEEFISGFEKVDEKELIETKTNKLRVIAECSKKENGEFIPDNNFLKVLDIIDDSSEKIKWYEGNTDRYITDGKCRKGNIDLIREKVFNRNTDLMVYVLSRMNVIYQPGYDMRVYNIIKLEYEEKIDKYLERLNSIENNRKNNKLNSEKSNNIKLQGEER